MVVAGDGVPRLAGAGALPGVVVADTGAFQRLTSRPETDARGVGCGVEVAEEDDVGRYATAAERLVEVFEVQDSPSATPRTWLEDRRLPPA
jgi:hypothetical protein